MHTEFSRQLITVVTEAVLEAEIEKVLNEAGAKGYTISDVRGKGQESFRSGDWKESANIQIQIVCKPELADNIIHSLRDKFFENYHMIIYLSDVQVLRSEKF